MKLRNRFLITLSILLLFFTTLILLRQPILDLVIRKAQEKVKQRFGATLIIQDAGFLGFRDIYMKNVILIPPDGKDTLFMMQSLKARIRISKLLKMQIGFRELVVDNVEVNLVKTDSSHSNYLFLFKKRIELDTAKVVNTDGYNERFKMLFKKVNDIFNEDITIRQFVVNYQDVNRREMVKIPELFFDGSLFQSSIITSSLEGVNLWVVKGKADADKGHYDFAVKRTRGAAYALPFFDLIDGFKVCFDEANVKFSADESSDIIPVNGDFEMKNLLVNHWRISPDDVLMPNINFHLLANIATDSIQLAPGTLFQLNKLPVNITLRYSRNPEERITLDEGFAVADAQNLFSSLPEGMFHTFKGFKASGELTYSLHFDLLIKHPDSLSFDSQLKKMNFHILEYGSENFSKMSAPFSFLAMDGDRPIRSFIVGPENPMFTPYDQISDYLKNTILTSEDPSFFNHAGFVEESFRESIATNIKQGRFARGGSTISMQLVKNIHLSRNKTIARKLEEGLIVWLIEQNRLVSKERMFEVYLNIIEWGPNVYGIGEASHFYFGKTPKELTLAESIYLSSLIPHPKYFRYSFDAAGNLKPFIANYFKIVAGRLVKREKISQAEADSLQPIVHLNGMALQIVMPLDSVPMDSLELEQLQIQ